MDHFSGFGKCPPSMLCVSVSGKAGKPKGHSALLAPRMPWLSCGGRMGREVTSSDCQSRELPRPVVRGLESSIHATNIFLRMSTRGLCPRNGMTGDIQGTRNICGHVTEARGPSRGSALTISPESTAPSFLPH